MAISHRHVALEFLEPKGIVFSTSSQISNKYAVLFIYTVSAYESFSILNKHP